MTERLSRRQLKRIASKLRPGPSLTGAGMWSPLPAGAEAPQDLNVEHEVEQIVQTVEAAGVLTRRRLYERIGARYWGPGRFRRALRTALIQGRIRRIDRDLFARKNRQE